MISSDKEIDLAVVDFSPSMIISVKCAFSKNAQSRFASVDFDLCAGTSALSVTNQTVSLSLCSSRSNSQGKPRAIEGRRVSSKQCSVKG